MLILVARYPNGVTMNQMHLPFAGMPGYDASHKSYKLAMNHYNNVLEWCSKYLVGPWECDHKDILYEGVRVRIGDPKDIAYFQLKWEISQ